MGIRTSARFGYSWCRARLRFRVVGRLAGNRASGVGRPILGRSAWRAPAGHRGSARMCRPDSRDARSVAPCSHLAPQCEPALHRIGEDRPGRLDRFQARNRPVGAAAGDTCNRPLDGSAHLHVAGADRTDEPVGGRSQRLVFARRHSLPNAHRSAAFLRRPATRTDLCPYRHAPDAAERCQSGDSAGAFRHRAQAHGQECRGPLSIGRRSKSGSRGLSSPVAQRRPRPTVSNRTARPDARDPHSRTTLWPRAGERGLDGVVSLGPVRG